MTLQLVGWTSLLAVTLYSSCGEHAVTLQYREVEDYTFSRAELRTIQAIADEATRDVRQLLPAIPRTPVLQVIPSNKGVIEEVGFTMETAGNNVYWGVSPDSDKRIAIVAETYLRPVMFQTLFRIVRTKSLGYVRFRSLTDYLIGSGLETVFARDFAATTYPWTIYPPEVSDWVAELLESPPGGHPPWLARYPDGRR